MGNVFQEILNAVMQNPGSIDQQLSQYGDPNTAQARVQELLSSGRMNQNQLNMIIPFAEKIYNARFGKR